MKKILLISWLVLFSTGLYAQSGSKLIPITRESATGIEDYFDPALKPFYHGVASGDPLQDRVIIWTRVTPDEEGPVTVNWLVSSTPGMTDIVGSGSVTTDVSRDYTVKVDVSGLAPATTYYYYFSAMGANSTVGRTRTAPAGNADQLRFAVVSCSNYQDGYFNAYERISERNDIDAVIHLGDYIYEYETGGFGQDELGRGHVPDNEIVTLMDYRIRYSYYRLDPQLRKVHKQLPFITIWDDHEFANNAWVGGAENHQEEEGDWDTRKNNAYQAYFEWMPIRERSSAPNRVYRKINYGNLVDLILLDTRIEGREKQKDSLLGIKREAAKNRDLQTARDYEEYLSDVLPASIRKNLTDEEYKYLIGTLSEWAAEDLPVADIKKLETREEFQQVQDLVIKSYKAEEEKPKAGQRTAADRQLLGEEQFSWLENNLKTSNAKWKIVANQVLLMPLKGIPLTDTWDGYEDSRERLLGYIKDQKLQNVVFLTGDIHMTLASDLPTSFFSYTFNKKNSAAVEFVTPSITSSNLDEFIGISEGFLTWLVGLFNPHIKNTDLKQHGYFVLTVNNSKAQADWYYVDDVKTIAAGQKNGESWYVNSGDTRLNKASTPMSATNGYGERAPEQAFSASVKKQPVLLIGNYPNPAEGQTTIHYVLAEESEVNVSIVDLQGNAVKDVMTESPQGPGIYALQVGIADLKPGIYLYEISTRNQKVVRRMVVK